MVEKQTDNRRYSKRKSERELTESERAQITEARKDVISTLQAKSLAALYADADKYGLDASDMSRQELIIAVAQAMADQDGHYFIEGVLEIMHPQDKDPYGFLRPVNYGPSREDLYVSYSQLRLGLRQGDLLSGIARPARLGQNGALLW